jgi:hypothetical protein
MAGGESELGYITGSQQESLVGWLGALQSIKEKLSKIK